MAIVGCGIATRAFASDAVFRHVRSSNDALRENISAGYQRSTTFRSLVDAIEAASVVVYVEPAAKLANGREGALLHLVAGSRDLPVLRVLVQPNLGDVRTIAVVAHELQHVIEAVQVGALDSSTMTRGFAALDPEHADGFGAFETEAARVVQASVLAELRRQNRRR